MSFIMVSFENFCDEIGRALVGLSYMRFGDVFSKHHPSQSEGLFRLDIISC